MLWFAVVCLVAIVLVDALLVNRQPFSVVLFVKSERREFGSSTVNPAWQEYSRLVTLAPTFNCRVQICFLVGRGPPVECSVGRVMVCASASDDYLDLPLKTWEALRYGVELEADGFVLLNSNVRFRAEDLLAEVRRSRHAHYWGLVLDSRLHSSYFAHKAALDQRIQDQLKTRAPTLLQYPLRFERELRYCSGRLYFLSAALSRFLVGQPPPQLDAWALEPHAKYVVRGDDLFEDIMVGRRVPAQVERTPVKNVFWTRAEE